MTDSTPERFPKEVECLARVRERAAECGARRRQRLEAARDLTPRRFTEALDALRVRMADSARQTPKGRGSAFVPLLEHDLALLDRTIEQYEATRRLRVLRDHERVQALLDILRVDYIVGEPIVSGAVFRDVARELFREAMPFAIGHAEATRAWSRDGSLVDNVVVVLPWRAALIAGEVYRSMGVEDIWHLGARRNEQTLATEIYYEAMPVEPAPVRPQREGSPTHLICDPMLATGGTTITAIERVRRVGVPVRNIVVHAAIAAPEGVDLILHTYPELRIVTCALDECLDRNGYIAGPGLGDFGDLAMAGIDDAYAQEHWVRPGLLRNEQARLVLDRTRGLAADVPCH